ncbi:MAG: Arm DNA-binding domain-containing protein [Acetobacter malorum]
MDEDLKGFGLRVTERGSKVFLFQYRFAGRVRRMVLGPYGDLTPAQARKRAEEARGLYLAGRDAAGEKKAHALAAAAERESQTAQAAADAPASLRSSFAALLDRPARSLATTEIQAHLDDVALRYPVTARRLHACGRSMFGWAEKRNLVPCNPFSDVVMEGREASRERVLTDSEIAAVWNAAGGACLTRSGHSCACCCSRFSGAMRWRA